MDTKTTSMILGWLGDDTSESNIQRVAVWMRDSLRIGGVKGNRELIRQALASRTIALRVKALVDTGATAIEALKSVCGVDVVDQMIDSLYHELRGEAR